MNYCKLQKQTMNEKKRKKNKTDSESNINLIKCIRNSIVKRFLCNSHTMTRRTISNC